METNDQIRELGKVLDTVSAVEQHLYHKDMMNAELHMSREVRHTPLYSSVADAKATILNMIERLREDPEKTLVKGAHEWPKQ